MFDRIQSPKTKEEWIDRHGSYYTAWVYFFFWLIGGLSLVKASAGLYYYLNPVPNDPPISITHVILAFMIAILFLIGAREVGRFNRLGLTFIAIGFFIMVASLFSVKPSVDDLIWDVLTVIALVIAWYDLAPEGHGSLGKSS